MAAVKRQRAYTAEEKSRVVEQLNNGETQANSSSYTRRTSPSSPTSTDEPNFI